MKQREKTAVTISISTGQYQSSSGLLGRLRNYRSIQHICSTTMVFYEKICLKESETWIGGNVFQTKYCHAAYHTILPSSSLPRPVAFVYYLYHWHHHQGCLFPLGSIKWFLALHKTEVFCWYLILLYIRLTMKNLIGREHSINSQ